MGPEDPRERDLERARILFDLAGGGPADSPPPPPEEVRRAAEDPASRFGKFVLVAELGRGGTASVYKAWQEDLRRFVALKILQTRDPDALARFHRETGLAAALVHPHIAPVLEVGSVGERPYLAMPLFDGTPLGSDPLPPRRAAQIVRDAARAVHFAHERGVLHRDLKPQNLLLDRDGRVWVTDFGLARPLAGGATVTASGTVLGTPSYMAPEQARGEGVGTADRRTDVYGLGATLYHLLTGRPPFPGTEIVRILRQVVEEDPVPPRRLVRDVPPPLQAVVLRCLEKDPARRYATAEELAGDLDRFLGGGRPAARPPGTIRRLGRWGRRRPALASAAGLILLSAALWAAREALRARDFSAALRVAGGLESAGRWDEATRLYERARALRPGDPRPAEGARRVERRRAAREWSARGRASEEALRRLREELEELRSRRAALRGTFDEKKTSFEEKQRLWGLEEELERRDGEEGRLFGEAAAAFTRALELDPEDDEARRVLARLYLDEYERADDRGDPRGASAARKVVETLDDGTLAPRLFRGGWLTVDTAPPGAEIRAARFVPGPDRRLAPASVELKGRTPLRDLPMERGSWMILLRREGFAEVRWPVLVEKGGRPEGQIPLFTEEEIGPGFVYVPPGEFLAGGDPRAAYGEAAPARIRLEGFFISRGEVSCAWYDSVTGRPAGHPGCSGEGAVRGVSWEEAAEFCRRLSRADPGAEYRLPTALEWEKAARGADGRAFPWGDFFDWEYLRRPGLDVSPYGATDMASGVREWCSDWYGTEEKYKVVKGGSSALTLEPFFRCAARVWFEPGKRPPDVGFRVVKVPRSR